MVVEDNDGGKVHYTAEWLIARGYDGLYDTCPDNDECGCPVSDLRPCDKDWRVGRKCRPGHKIGDVIGRRDDNG